MGSNYGQGSITSQPKQKQAGPPFVAASANNGLSVSPTGEIVLGNDVGGTAAQLLSDREINFNAFTVAFIDPLGNTIQFTPSFGITCFNGAQTMLATLSFGELSAFDDAGGGPFVRVDSSLGGAGMRLTPGTKRLSLESTAAEGLAMFDFTNGDVIIGDYTNDFTGLQFFLDDSNRSGDLGNNANNARYSINGTLGVSGNFTTADAKTVTVQGGIITSIV